MGVKDIFKKLTTSMEKSLIWHYMPSCFMKKKVLQVLIKKSISQLKYIVDWKENVKC